MKAQGSSQSDSGALLAELRDMRHRVNNNTGNPCLESGLSDVDLLSERINELQRVLSDVLTMHIGHIEDEMSREPQPVIPPEPPTKITSHIFEGEGMVCMSRVAHSARSTTYCGMSRDIHERFCPSVLMVAGCDYPCDQQCYPHPGWAHSNKAAEAIWAGDPRINQHLPDGA